MRSLEKYIEEIKEKTKNLRQAQREVRQENEER